MSHNTSWQRALALPSVVTAVCLGIGAIGAPLGCAHNAMPVQFSETWPAQAGDYEDVSEKWTRRGILREPLAKQASQIMEIYATVLSTQWRAAYVARQSSRQKMNSARLKKLQARQQENARSATEVELLVSTYHPEHNDLHREQSIWSVILVDASGQEFAATSVEKDHRPREAISAEFPHLGDFAAAYRVTFPYSATLWQGDKLTLRVSSSLGTVEVQWSSEPAK